MPTLLPNAITHNQTPVSLGLLIEPIMTSHYNHFNWAQFERCTEKHFDLNRHDRQQKRTFTRWINQQFSLVNNDRINDLFYDLRNGHRLITLIEILTGQRLQREKIDRRLHHLQNVRNVLKFLDTNYDIRLINLRAEDIVDGNATLTLSLLWSIIYKFQIRNKEMIVEWCRKSTNINVKDFTYSWRDGSLLASIIRRYRPDLIGDTLQDIDSRQRLENIFQIAYEDLGIARLLEPEDVDCSHSDEKSILTYVAMLYDRLGD